MTKSSKLLDEAVEAFASLPGIGKKSAMRLALFMLDRPQEEVQLFTNQIQHFRDDVKHCVVCGHLSDDDHCSICLDHKRNTGVICVVESIRDVLAVESTEQFFGRYHILGGVISPIDGVGPDALRLDELIQRIDNKEVQEIILALRPSIDGDTTAYYLSKKLSAFDVKISIISRGVSFGGALEYADELTLGRSIHERLPYNPQALVT